MHGSLKLELYEDQGEKPSQKSFGSGHSNVCLEVL